MAILSKNRNHGRQWPLVAIQSFDYTELENGAAVAAVKVPGGSRVIGGFVQVLTAFDGTTPTLDVGDGTDPDRYTASVVDLTAAGRTALTLDGVAYSTPDYVDLSFVVTGTPTQGEGLLVVEYVMDSRSNEVVPDYD